MSTVLGHALALTNYVAPDPPAENPGNDNEGPSGVVIGPMNQAMLEQAYGRELADIIARMRDLARRDNRPRRAARIPLLNKPRGERRAITGGPASASSRDVVHPTGLIAPDTRRQARGRAGESNREDDPQPPVGRAAVSVARPLNTVAVLYGIFVALVGIYALSSVKNDVSGSYVAQHCIFLSRVSLCLLDSTPIDSLQLQDTTSPTVNSVPVSCTDVNDIGVSSWKGFNYAGLTRLQDRLHERMLPRSTSGQLAVDMNFAGLTAKELVVAIEASDFVTKGILRDTLEEFSRETRAIGRDSQRLSAKVYSVIDTIIAFNDYSLHAMASASSSTTHSAAEYAQTSSVMHTLSAELDSILSDADSIATSLNLLDEHLLTIATIWDQESRMINVAAQRLRSELWTMVGGNQADRLRIAYHEDLLRNLDEYRSASAAYMAATSEALLVLTADLFELCRKLTVSPLADGAVLFEVILRSIERSARRMAEDRLKTPIGEVDAEMGASGAHGRRVRASPDDL
ncbi:hypothetical protein C8Q76DRAFT_792824 [Earliella scabrosa]|nr:hypothetical protein C8Q76DRAFT_792824 [Earliella scabrosa]